MTIKQLIDELAKLDPELEAKIENLGTGASGDVCAVEDVLDYDYDASGHVKNTRYVSIQANHMS